jgi:KaiC/GvpD/RAD55 family RecA-like ATPase
MGYGLDLQFERAVVALAALDRQFFGVIGHALDYEQLEDDDAKRILVASQEIARETGRGPGSLPLVMQRLRRQMNEGRFVYKCLTSSVDVLLDTIDDGLPDADDAVIELRPILQRLAKKEALQSAYDAYAKRADFDTAITALRKAEQIGMVEETFGVRIGSDAGFEEISKMQTLDKLPTGMDDVDLALGGGLGRGQLGLWVGETGTGKSMACSQCYASSLLLGQHAAYATTELPEGEVLARVKSALTDIPIDEVMAGEPEVSARLEDLAGQLGVGWVRSFTAHAVTVADLVEWIDECERKVGRPVDLLVIDYADHLSAPGSASSYESGRIIFDALRKAVRRRSFWVWTNSQAKGREKRKRLDNRDVADSMHKARSVHTLITLTSGEQNGEETIEPFLAKNTSGRSRISAGALVAEKHLGRIAPSALQTAAWREQPYEGL